MLKILMLVDDLRNHPMQTFVSENLPVVLSPDDPVSKEREKDRDRKGIEIVSNEKLICLCVSNKKLIMFACQ